MRRCFIALVILIGAQRAAAQSMLDLVPKDAAGAIAIRDLDELIEKGDKFLTDTEIRMPLRPSQLFAIANNFLGIQKGLDKKGPAAILAMPPTKPNEYSLELLVPVIPFTDADAMASNFGFAKGELLPRKILKTKRGDPMVAKYATRSGKHFYLSGADDTLERVLKSKRITASLTPAQRKTFNDGDILLHLGRYLWTQNNGDLAKEIASKVKPGDDPNEREFAKRFAESLKEVQDSFFGVRINDGLEGHFLATVPKDGQAAKLLATLRGQRKSSTLRGLPEGDVLFAQASSGDSAQHGLLAKSLFGFVLEDLLIQQKLVSNVDRLQYLGILHEVWSRLDGNRLAVYQNVNETKVGLFTALAILDVEDPSAFLAEMKALAKMASADTLDWGKKEVQAEIDIPRLVKSLGSSAFAIRQSANTKLALIGEPALPYLQKAIDVKDLDLETLRRCQALRQRIGDVAAERRKELLRESGVPLFLRPRLTFIANAEKRQDRSIDAIQIKVIGKEKDVVQQSAEYKQLLGPDWDKVRLAVVGKQIVVMLGSNTELFDATLQNVQKNEAGLAETKRLAPFFERSARERLFEFHISVEGILRLTTPMAKLGTKLQLTSAALSLGPQALQLDARVPTAEVRAIARKAQDAGQ